jgi:hypothetical protein
MSELLQRLAAPEDRVLIALFAVIVAYALGGVLVRARLREP